MSEDPLRFIGMGGRPFGTVGVVSVDGTVTDSKVVEDSGKGAQESARPLTDAQRDTLEAADIDADGAIHAVELPGLGSYRVEAVPAAGGTTILVGIPSTEVSGALTTLILVEVCVTAARLELPDVPATVRPIRRDSSRCWSTSWPTPLRTLRRGPRSPSGCWRHGPVCRG